MFRNRSKLLLLPLAALLAAGCDGGTGSETSTVSIRLTDAPGDLAEAWVKVERVYLQGVSSADSTSGRTELLTTPTDWIDLLTLADRTAELVGGVAVPPGTYSQLRFVVCDAWVRTESGDVYATQGTELPAGVTADGELKAPSACQSGFKVKLPGGGMQVESGANVVVVDFDVSQSFGHQAGKSGKWIMHPVLTATEVGVGGGISGTVALAQGVTLPTCGGGAVDVTRFVPLAIAGADSLSGATRADGTYGISPVAPATYTMAYAQHVSFTNGDTLTFTAAATPASVVVGTGGSATSAYQVTAATCKVKPAS